MAISYLHGGKYKLYGANLPTIYAYDDDLKNAFSTSIFIREIELILPDITGSTSVKDETHYLYKWNNTTGQSDYQESTANIFDNASKNWQLGSIFLMHTDTYVGNVPVQSILNMFPYAYKFEDFGYTTLYFTRDEINTVWALSLDNYSSKALSFLKDSLKNSNDCGLSYINFYPSEGSQFASKGFVRGYFNFYSNKRFSSFDGWPYGSDDSFLAGYRFADMKFNSDFISVMEGNFTPTNDPYDSGGDNKGTGGKYGGSGSGTFDNTSDEIDIPSLPTYSAVDTGFITIFNPTISELKNLANYMWSNDLFNIDTWKKIFDNPMDAILGLSIVPVSVPEGGVSDVTVGNILTTVSMTKASSQYVQVNCGSLNMDEYWGGYMDYAPYTKAELYLPYCGTHPINIDDIMGKTVQVVYHVDILSGACCAYVKCGTSVLYSFVGQCSSSIPITSSDMSNVISGVITMGASIGSMVATGGLSAPITASTVGFALSGINSSSVGNVMAMKPTVEKSGAMGSTGGMLGIQTPYLIITRPKQCLPVNQNTYTGYPSYITSQLSSLSGFTTIESIHLSNMSCTDEEKNEIEQILMQGVIL
jgi:hypothetical protein